jgi:hypothetical protein
VTSSALRTWTITSGADRVWTTGDCPRSKARAHQRLRPGETVSYRLVWDRHRSATGCPSDTPEAGPGTYRLDVTVNGASAPTVVFHLTG